MADGITIGEAYLQIRPSMDGVAGEIEQAMGDAGSKGANSFRTAPCRLFFVLFYHSNIATAI